MKCITRSVAATMLTGLSLVAVSCSRPDTTASPHGATGNKTATLIMSTLNNPFFVSVKNGAQAEAAKAGITLNVQNANNSDATELDLATTAVTKRPGILIVDPVSSQSGTASVNAANQAGVPAMAFDRQPDGGKLATFVGYDAIQAGSNAADALATAVHDTGNIVEIQGIMGTNVAQDRSKGFEQELAKHPGIHIVATQAADFDRATALNVMTNILQAHPDVTGVYAANDEMAMGVLAALQARNVAGKIALVGNDGIADSLAAIQDGQMSATNAESAFELGERVADLAGNILAGKSVAPNTVLHGQIVTKDTVKSYADHLTGIGDGADVPPNLK